LIKAELVYRRGLLHTLVRDTADESSLKEKRRLVHTRILTELETDKDTAPEVLAVHAKAASLTNQAINLWQAASKAAITRLTFDKAISNLRPTSHGYTFSARELALVRRYHQGCFGARHSPGDAHATKR
jgi:hypothetical protein